jgi:hypothetical protein
VLHQIERMTRIALSALRHEISQARQVLRVAEHRLQQARELRR